MSDQDKPTDSELAKLRDRLATTLHRMKSPNGMRPAIDLQTARHAADAILPILQAELDDRESEFKCACLDDCNREMSALRVQRDDALSELTETRGFWTAAKGELSARDETIRKLRESLAELLSMSDITSDGETEWERAVNAARALLAEGEAHARHDG